MRKLGGILLLAGVLAAFYSSTRLQTVPPLPDGVLALDAFDHEAGRWTVARYAAVAAAAAGALLLLFPKGR